MNERISLRGGGVCSPKIELRGVSLVGESLLQGVSGESPTPARDAKRGKRARIPEWNSAEAWGRERDGGEQSDLFKVREKPKKATERGNGDLSQ